MGSRSGALRRVRRDGRPMPTCDLLYFVDAHLQTLTHGGITDYSGRYPMPCGVTVRERSGYSATCGAVWWFPSLTMSGMTQSREPDVGS